ncbi:SpoIIE family protein phosphatase [Streptomyces sp. SID3212]|uniref:SpoIIE family protein phosphatase n=1 Tax=Streptomyces sp. SID3212 TaxID=2690259 RepID=UPI0013693E36|nr:SpoIIE family protein phosphatase [Streptomyces sp. SID3212]MYV57855.1 SpoIIE family protein phosphatase [Streptomyces sp. SID3212]
MAEGAPAPTGTTDGTTNGTANGELLSALFAHATAGMYAVDAADRVIACNPWAERILGHRPGGLIGLDAERVLHPSHDDAKPGERAVLLRADGTPLPVWWTSAPLPGQQGTVVIFHDTGAEGERNERRSDRYAHSEIAREQAEFDLAEATWLSELTLAMVSTLEAEEGLARLARLLVPRLADGAVIDLIADHGRVRRTAWTHREPDQVPAEVLEADPPLFGDASTAPLAKVLRGGPTQQLNAPFRAALNGTAPSVPVPAPAAAAPAEAAPAAPVRTDALGRATTAMLADLGASEALIVPLRLRDSTFGALTLTRSATTPPFDDADRVLAEEVARRTALGLENARLHAQQADIAATLQRALLTDLPHVETLELAAHYQPAEHTAEVGGDWYDAFLLPDGDLALVVGDVTGHDIQAAARMSELRNMLRALAVDRPEEDPGSILQRLDRAQAHLRLADAATVVLARLRAGKDGAWRLSWSTAGHPPPLVVAADGTTRYLDEAHAMLIGLLPATSRPTVTTELPPGSTLLLYTDGLIESRTQDIDSGLRRLRGHAAAHHTQPLDRLCIDLVRHLGDTRDDITLIGARIPPRG